MILLLLYHESLHFNLYLVEVALAVWAFRGNTSWCKQQGRAALNWIALCCHLGLSLRSSPPLHHTTETPLLPFKMPTSTPPREECGISLSYMYMLVPEGLAACGKGVGKQNYPPPPSPLPCLLRGNWWRYPTMPQPISSCWLGVGVCLDHMLAEAALYTYYTFEYQKAINRHIFKQQTWIRLWVLMWLCNILKHGCVALHCCDGCIVLLKSV